MIRILIIADDPTLNTGYARVARFVATTLADNNYHIRYLPCNSATPDADRTKFNFELESFDFNDRFVGKRLQPTLNKFKPSLVIVFGEFGLIGYIGNVCRQLGVRSMYYMPVEGNAYPPKIVNVEGGHVDYALTLQKFNYIVAYSQFGADNINKLLPGIVTDIIPHQVDTDIFRPLNRDAVFKNFFPGLCENPGMDKAFIVGHVGRNQRRKGTDYVLQGFAHFLKNYVDADKMNAYLFLTTDPNDAQGYHLMDMIDSLKLRGHVIINPVVGGKQGPTDNQLAEIYNTFDTHLCPHRAEGFGLPVLEAMASGVKVITTNYSTPPEFGKGVVTLIEPSWYEPTVGTNCEWAVLNPADIAAAINTVYQDVCTNGHVIDFPARLKAEQYSNAEVAKKWCGLMKDIRLQELSDLAEDKTVGLTDTEIIMDSYINEVL